MTITHPTIPTVVHLLLGIPLPRTPPRLHTLRGYTNHTRWVSSVHQQS